MLENKQHQINNKVLNKITTEPIDVTQMQLLTDFI